MRCIRSRRIALRATPDYHIELVRLPAVCGFTTESGASVEVQLIITGGKVSKKSVALKVPSTIGRGRDATLSIHHPMISRHHCKLFETNGLVMVRDMGSLNGTFVDGQRVIEAPLPPEAEFSVGPLTFRVEYKYAGDLAVLPAPKLAKPVDADKTDKTVVVAKTIVAAKPTAAAKPATAVKPTAAAKPAAAKPAATSKPAAAKPAAAAKPTAAPKPAAAKSATDDDDFEIPDFEELEDTPVLGLRANPQTATAKNASAGPAANAPKSNNQPAGKPASKPSGAQAGNVKKPAGK